MLDVWIMAASPSRRDALAKCVNDEPEMRVAGTASTFAFLRSLMLESSADIALIDLESEPQSTTARDWLAELIDLTPIVLLTPEPDRALFDRTRRAGTGALLQANASSEQVIQAIKSVAVGLSVFDGSFAHPSPEDESAVEPLTARESEVLRLLAEGLGNKEIALKLNISEHTIKFHIRSILGKLGAASRTEAVTRGLRSGLIEL
jgi:two-component system, NarL family, response regulator YdfI